MSNQSPDEPAGAPGPVRPAHSQSAAEPSDGHISGTAPTVRAPAVTPASMRSGDATPSLSSGSGTGSGTGTSTGSQRRASAAELTIGMILAERYQILERLSAGGMGVVYKARHVALDDMVAVKILLKPQKEEDQRRFLLEARLASKIKHPNTVYISDFGVMPDGRSYLAMEFLQGQTLASAIKKVEMQRRSEATTKPEPPVKPEKSGAVAPVVKPDAAPKELDLGMEPLRVCRIAVQIARGLQAVHDKGIVHRDLKPENIFLLEQDGQPDFVKIVDFGIAKVTRVVPGDKSAPPPATLSREEFLQAAQQAGDSVRNLQNATLPGSVMGTPAYMSPEAIDGKRIDSRADQYSLGCVLYEMLSGKTPFHSRSTAGMLMKHLSAAVQPLSKSKGSLASLVPESLDALVLRLLAKTPDERFPSMRDVELALEREIDLMLVARGEKTVLPSALAGAIAGKGFGTALVIGRRRIPLLALLPLAVLLVAAGGLLTYRLVGRTPSKPTLAAGELASLRQQALAVLKKDLADPALAPPLRLGAIAALGYGQDPVLRPDLESELKRPGASPELRVQAIESLALLGDRGAVPVLLPLLDDKSVTASGAVVATAAAAALRQLGEPRGQQTLLALLDGKQPEAQFQAALLLCEQGPAKARELLHDILKRPGVPDAVRLDINACLARAGETEARTALRSQQQEPGPTVPRIWAAARLAQLGDGPARVYLLELIQKKDSDQLLAARLIAGPDQPGLRDLFREIAAASGAATEARKLGAEGLGATAELFDARLLGTLLDPKTDASLRQSAAGAILQLAAHDPTAWSTRSLAWARGAMVDRDWLVRQAAVAVLGDSTSEDAVVLLGIMLKDSDTRVRRSAARALGRRSERAALAILRQGLDDADPMVRVETLKALGRLIHTLTRQGVRDLASELAPVLTRLIEKGSATERLLALGLLGRIGDRGQLERLLDFKDTPDAEVRRLFIEQLEGHPELLVAALADKDFAVRFTAARRLAELPKPDLRAVPVLREGLDRGGATGVLAYALLARLGQSVPSTEELLAMFSKSSESERLAALEAAARLPLEAALALLTLAAHDPSAEVRRQAAEVAAELPVRNGQRAGVPVLQLLISDADESVRARAQALLARLGLSSKATGESAEPAPGAADGAQQDGGSSNSTESKDAAAATEKSSASGPNAKPGPQAETPTAPDAASELEGVGLLALKGPDYLQYQLDGKRWQYLGPKPIKLPPGPHKLVTMSGKQELVIEEKKTKTIELAPSAIEEAAHSGIEAYGRKDYDKAQKLLERAYQRCDRARGLVQPCENLTAELQFFLGRVHEDQGRTEEAATDYQQVVDATAHGRLTEKQRETAASSLHNLSKRLGMVIVTTADRGQCKEKKMWMATGRARVKVGSVRVDANVLAGQPIRVGSCP